MFTTMARGLGTARGCGSKAVYRRLMMQIVGTGNRETHESGENGNTSHKGRPNCPKPASHPKEPSQRPRSSNRRLPKGVMTFGFDQITYPGGNERCQATGQLRGKRSSTPDRKRMWWRYAPAWSPRGRGSSGRSRGASRRSIPGGIEQVSAYFRDGQWVW